MASETFPYSKSAFILNMVVLTILIAATVLVLFVITTEIIYIAMILAIEATLLMVLGASPFLTAHEVTKDTLILRQGWYFKARIPLSNVKKASRLEKGPLRMGVFFRLFSSTLYVTARRTDLIEVELKEAMTFSLALGKRADRVVFDAQDPQRLISRLER